VGTRKPTPYGKQVTEKLTGELVFSGITIVSGLARGVDGLAHRITLERKGTTIAVLGCGVDIIYPPDHQTLYYDILKSGGAVISEVPPGHTVARGLFPARNRIISGISRGVLVTEGAEDSGSLITAQCALDQGRDVFAVPGPISSYLSAGPAKLIKQGAKVVTEVADILDELKISPSTYHTNRLQQKLREKPEEQQMIDLIASGTVHFDDIVRALHLSPATVGSILTVLELDGILQNLGNGEYGLN
jgi:DNA processing protein